MVKLTGTLVLLVIIVGVLLSALPVEGDPGTVTRLTGSAIRDRPR